ncbi:uncharacterized protein A4U43_C07F22890 [Asparagus officinalis]|uniref:Pectinesterase inhibitor domain-containing protein n=1 Tax=Asparagus officinalis TaxID=4686 RepID=A0A5P1EG40_ASPOF|nr:uncharacterized protein A4U43_C07F22890 [Asparagus officinalis]
MKEFLIITLFLTISSSILSSSAPAAAIAAAKREGPCAPTASVAASLATAAQPQRTAVSGCKANATAAVAEGLARLPHLAARGWIDIVHYKLELIQSDAATSGRCGLSCSWFYTMPSLPLLTLSLGLVPPEMMILGRER